MIAQGYLDLLAGPELDLEERDRKRTFIGEGRQKIYLICGKRT